MVEINERDELKILYYILFCFSQKNGRKIEKFFNIRFQERCYLKIQKNIYDLQSFFDFF